jgi:hypothetical protein
MPVLKSVELKVVDCASAGRVLRARTAAAMKSDRNRERIFGRMCLMIFIRIVLLFICWGSDSFAASREHFDRSETSLACLAHNLKWLPARSGG